MDIEDSEYYEEFESFEEEENNCYDETFEDENYDTKIINIFQDIKQYIKFEAIPLCEMLKVEDIYTILEE